ncbi:hypothetical protein M1247_04535 [Mycobacterium sp. 21AC1]|uniref:hypothetical protein n=1 Tax=[Mycobacterium] appelbergii TaxID=2939269 RepID=UPI0029392A40|nr:hypothetical protein [Mycobacterium sp. 21AC1]MDV3124169.1 hypothetical protein [Mycobacterium sp. 21AC1]
MPTQVLQIDRIESTDERFASAKRWEYQIFGLENGYTTREDDAATEMCRYRRWEQSSEFFVGFDRDEQAVAILRALRCDPELGIDSFSTVCEAGAYPLSALGPTNMIHRDWQAFFATVSPTRVVDLASHAVSRRHRKTGVMEQLWRQLCDTLTTDGVSYVTVALAVPLFNRYRTRFGEAVEQFGEVLPGYLGVDSVPAIVDLTLLEPRR